MNLNHNRILTRFLDKEGGLNPLSFSANKKSVICFLLTESISLIFFFSKNLINLLRSRAYDSLVLELSPFSIVI